MEKMRVLSVEVLNEGALTIFRREARRKRREDRQRIENMTNLNVIEILRSDISSFIVRSALLENKPERESPLPLVTKDEVGEYEEPDGVALLQFAEASQWKPVLVEFSREPSKAFENTLRQSAKARNFLLHFYRLTGRWAAVKVHPKTNPQDSGANLLPRLGIEPI
jgi:hypothetical protein